MEKTYRCRCRCNRRGLPRNVGVVLFNHGDEDLEVKRGDRVAQLILKNFYADIIEVADLDSTARGEGGFGSTGVSTTTQ